MSGVAAVRYLLANAVAVTNVAPATSIMSGRKLPVGTQLPAILVFTISGVPMNVIHNAGRQRRIITERVQVSVLAHNYATVKTLMPLVFNACPSQRATINGVAVQSITLDFVHPDLDESAVADYVIPSAGCDFLVRWEHTPS